VSLKLRQLDSFRGHPKEYTLKPTSKERLRSKHPGQALVFSEQHLPGFKPKPFSWENVDEDGNVGQGRSQLYEKNKRDQKQKENNGRFQPYAKKPIPKKTALAGTVVRELEAVIVKNNEYYGIEDKLQNERMEKHKKEQEASIIVTDPAEMKRLRAGNASYMATDAQKAAVHKVSSHICRYGFVLLTFAGQAGKEATPARRSTYPHRPPVARNALCPLWGV
jgi:TFIIF, beta subunit N-terminus